mmetsp:Transcript_35929/g.58085  ORF Transcript_35929/g.58085 Transcript_35929/m.58085 type:complete len:146 (-) Transcript_35929:733-1170(-)
MALKGPSMYVHVEKIPENAAMMYRLLGDDNALHIDEAEARRRDFPRPILHGLCTFGFAARAIDRFIMFAAKKRDSPVCEDFCVRRICARFSKHVFPGETLLTEVWSEKSSVAFQCRVAERNVIVLSNGRAEIGGAGSTGGLVAKL